MAVMLVTYDLNKAGKNYAGLIAAIEAYTHCKTLKSAWFIQTSQTAVQVRDNLFRQMDGDDALVVVRFHKGDWATYVTQPVNDWLNAPGRAWD